MTENRLRASQKEILAYQKGLMGISAVPGSGKTWTLTQLAVKLILTADLAEDQEVLVVTFSNSAADNISSRIAASLRAEGLIEGLGYRVRTLHGLANDILHERPDLAGLPQDYSVIDEKEADMLLLDLVSRFNLDQPHYFDQRLSEDFVKKMGKQNNNEEVFLNGLKEMAGVFIRTLKDNRLSPNQFSQLAGQYATPSDLLQFGMKIYENYQFSLNYRASVDFDDLIRLALDCLDQDPELVTQLRRRWPFILEDEAQDSSLLQEEMLSLLTGISGNWVRVGDPNQAINESFTTANPQLLKNFLSRADVLAYNLPESGRSSRKIIALANRLNLWTQNQHPALIVRDALSLPLIQPTQPGDPQPNPADSPQSVELVQRSFSPEQEANYLAESIRAYLEQHPDDTLAVLALTNNRIAQLADTFKKAGLPVADVLMRLPEATRHSAGAVARILRSILHPLSPTHLAGAFEVTRRSGRDDGAFQEETKMLSGRIGSLARVEDYLYPLSGSDWLEDLRPVLSADQLEALAEFRRLMRKWHLASGLRLDQLILVIAQDLNFDIYELATVHKLSILIRDLAQDHPDWSFETLTEELISIARDKRRFAALSEDEQGFDPEQYRGQIIVATLHKSKGLEWDKVYLTSVNNYDFPAGDPIDTYRSEYWYFKGRQNPQAALRAEVEAIIEGLPIRSDLEERSLHMSRAEQIRERLRLFYVGITRAKKSLTITSNKGRKGNAQPAVAFQALWEERTDD